MNEPIPTIGRRIWYWPGLNDVRTVLNHGQPCDAGIVFVHPDETVNLSVTDHAGFIRPALGVTIYPADSPTPSNKGYAQWMPYQVKADADRAVTQPHGNKVTPGEIQALKDRVIYRTAARLMGTTSTFVHAYLDDKFYLGSGHSACVDPANFDSAKGISIARKNAEYAVDQKLWELEGYALWKKLQ